MNNQNIGEFRHRLPMHMGQLVEVKGDINLESVQVVPASMGFMGFPPMGGQVSLNPFPQMGFPGGINVNFGGAAPSPYAPPPPPISVSLSFFEDQLDEITSDL